MKEPLPQQLLNEVREEQARHGKAEWLITQDLANALGYPMAFGRATRR